MEQPTSSCSSSSALGNASMRNCRIELQTHCRLDIALVPVLAARISCQTDCQVDNTQQSSRKISNQPGIFLVRIKKGVETAVPGIAQILHVHTFFGGCEQNGSELSQLSDCFACINLQRQMRNIFPNLNNQASTEATQVLVGSITKQIQSGMTFISFAIAVQTR